MRVLLGAFGDPGHAFPAIALGVALRARGHDVALQTWARWRTEVEAEGLGFAPAPEYDVGAGSGQWLKPYAAVVRATRDTLPLLDELRPDVVVADILTLAPALAAELRGVPWATLVPHVDPRPAPGFPVYSVGARLPRTAAGRGLWRRLSWVSDAGLQRGRAELNGTRERLGLPPLDVVHGGISPHLCLVATAPELEYPRPPGWAAAHRTHTIGPLLWEPPSEPVAPPPGDAPLVLVAPSTSQDPGHRLVRAALEGLAGLDVRVLATWNRRPPADPPEVPANAGLVAWLSYAQTMPRCDAVLCHAGHGTVVRALSSGCVPVCAPAAGDMNENAARVDWAGLGARVPRRLVTPRALRLAVGRALDDAPLRARVDALAGALAGRDAGATATALLEELAADGRGVARVGAVG